MNELTRLQAEIDRVFTGCFGRTPLRERLEDILREAMDLSRFIDHRHLKEEAGDLLCSVLQLFNECEWDAADQAGRTLAKIESRRLQYRSLGRKLSVAILGGAFDPITNGHLGVARFVLDTSRTFDEVWLMPCFEHMAGKRMADAAHRQEMCRLAAQRDGRVKVFPYEIDHQFRGETYHLVKSLLDEEFARDQFDFSLIIGQDNANTFANWVNGPELERLIRFVVVPRQGVALDPSATWYLRPPHVYLAAEGPIMLISSTRVREMLRSGDPAVIDYLDPDVLRYVNEHALYR
jgi:nicotinate-nucleotide adenylyltransferase